MSPVGVLEVSNSSGEHQAGLWHNAQHLRTWNYKLHPSSCLKHRFGMSLKTQPSITETLYETNSFPWVSGSASLRFGVRRILCHSREKPCTGTGWKQLPQIPPPYMSHWICWKPLTVVVAVPTSLCRSGAGLPQPIRGGQILWKIKIITWKTPLPVHSWKHCITLMKSAG